MIHHLLLLSTIASFFRLHYASFTHYTFPQQKYKLMMNGLK
ncbi:hypothetical protein D931_01330 [Enterococcus faecium 13.SD.W.09]|nr:hypothetical protein D931_01330 [Enterococcus faecium 13.SD.W.09]